MTQRKIAVAGATGRVGRHIVDVAQEAGHEAVPMSRSTGVDLATGEGLREALTGVDTVIDAASWPTNDQEPATEYFTAATYNLHREGRRAGVERIVAVSIIGTDYFTTGYNAAKVAHEQALLEGPLPVRILRAAQFHEFVPVLLEWTTQGDVAYLPEMRTQLVAARTVAEGLVSLANGSGSDDAISEIAGPREESLVDAARLLVEHRGDSIRVEGVTDPDNDEQVLWASGVLLPGADATLAGPTFEQWLDHN